MLAIFVYVIFLRICGIDSRVICTDIHANRWDQSGTPCPLKCENIFAAIDRLKMLDYHSELDYHNDQRTKQFNLEDFPEGEDQKLKEYARLRHRGANSNRIFFHSNPLLPHMIKYEMYAQVLKNPIVRNLMHREISYMITFERVVKNRSCPELIKSDVPEALLADLLTKCVNKSEYKDDFVRRLTSVLNAYAVNNHKFNKAITLALLNRILASNLDLRHPKVVSKLLVLLRKSMEGDRQMRTSVLHLSSRNCLSVYMPGCYCKSGYVEQSSLCVTPRSCLLSNQDIDKASIDEYLQRLIVE